ncbi:MAG: hypothetical protein WDM78_10030 [Puia sp.]
MQVVREIMKFISNGTRVVYITGNHDEMMRKYTDLNMGHFTLTDKLVFGNRSADDLDFSWGVFDNTTKGSARIIAKLGSNGYGMLILFNRVVNGLLGWIGREKVSHFEKR